MTQRWVATEFGGTEVLSLVDVDVPAPGVGEVRVTVRAVGMNPADYKRFAPGPNNDRSTLPAPIGFEVAGVVDAIGPDTELASGGGAPGDRVIAFRVTGGYAEQLVVPASDVFAAPDALADAAAANLLLAGATAADMLHVTAVSAGDTIVVHGASGAVGVSVLQQAAALGARVIGTASERNFDTVRRFGGQPVVYGDGLEQRLRDLAPDGYAAALDTVGTDEAADTSLALVDNRERIVTIANMARAQADGFRFVGGNMADSIAFRDSVRGQLIDLAADGRLVVPVARTFPFADAREALDLLRTGHPGGKLALLVDAT